MIIIFAGALSQSFGDELGAHFSQWAGGLKQPANFAFLKVFEPVKGSVELLAATHRGGGWLFEQKDALLAEAKERLAGHREATAFWKVLSQKPYAGYFKTLLQK